MLAESQRFIASKLTLAHLPSAETHIVENWLQFVANAFRGETVSSSIVSDYDDFDLITHKIDTTLENGDVFHQRWRRDPASVPGVAFLALIDSNHIVASVRYFPRQIYINGLPVSCGCIGDVVTAPEYRRQGIATKLLLWCIEEMTRDNIAVAYLHTGPQAPLYEKLGWFEVPMTRTYLKMTLSRSELSGSSPTASDAARTFRIRRLCLETVSDSIIEEMSTKYRDFCRQYRVTGSIVRSDPRYWRRYVDFECRRTQSSGILAVFDAQDKIAMWASLKVKHRRSEDGVLQVRVIELVTCTDSDVGGETPWEMFGHMILVALRTSVTSDVKNLDNTASSEIPFELLIQDSLLTKALKLPLHLPISVGDFTLRAIAIEHEPEEPIMYRIVTPSECAFAPVGESAQSELLRSGKECHIFQKGDAF